MKIEQITFLKNKSSNTDSDNRGDGTAEAGRGDLTSTELPRASRRTNLSRPVARSSTRSTDADVPAIPPVSHRRRGSAGSHTFGSDDGEEMKRRRNFQRSWGKAHL